MPTFGNCCSKFKVRVSDAEGAGNFVESRVKVALVTLLETPFTTAMAFTVCVHITFSGLVYKADDVVGVLPSMVYRISEPFVPAIATCAGAVRVDVAKLMVGAATVLVLSS